MLDRVAALAAELEQPARICVDGRTASGKTTFADALAARLPWLRVTIDDFRRPPPPREYYPSSFDFERFRAHLVSLSRTSTIVDGVFLHHPELRGLWDLTVFLHVDTEVATKRGIARDASWMANARERYATRYVPGETRYLDEVDPESLADVVVDTTDLNRPTLRVLRARAATRQDGTSAATSSISGGS